MMDKMSYKITNGLNIPIKVISTILNKIRNNFIKQILFGDPK